jgi:hypothetical protein
MQRKIENVKGKWVIFEVETVLGKTFKTKVAEYKTKAEAEAHKI